MKKSPDGRYWGNSFAPEKPALIECDRWICVEVELKCNTVGEADGEQALWIDGKEVGRWKGILLRRPPGGDVPDPAVAREAGIASSTGSGAIPSPPPYRRRRRIRWRTDETLKVNGVWIMRYVTENAAKQNKVKAPEKVRVWCDDVVVSKSYIGPANK
jgi:hypothetical protein